MKIVCIGSSSVEGIGDSLGLGWVGRLNNYLQENSHDLNKYRVFNLGMKGDTIQDTIDSYNDEAKRRRPHLVLIYTGGNDCMTHIKNGKLIREPNVKDYSDKWKSFLKILKSAEHKTIVLGPTMPCEEYGPSVKKDLEIYFKESDLKEYNTNLKRLCKDEGVEFLELFDLFKDNQKHYCNDFIHPNANGYDLITQQLIKYIKVLP